MATDNKLFTPELVQQGLREAVVKLKPQLMIKNPVMFTVEIGTVVMLIVTILSLINPDLGEGSFGYNLAITILLFLTVLFGNFAEALAEARGKAQAATLRKTREETTARRVKSRRLGAGGSLITTQQRRHLSGRSGAISFRPTVRLWRDWPPLMSRPSRANRLR